MAVFCQVRDSIAVKVPGLLEGFGGEKSEDEATRVKG